MSQKPHVRISPCFPHMLPVSVTRSSSNGSAICYVLPVLWDDDMFSHSGANEPESKSTRMFRRVPGDKFCRLRPDFVTITVIIVMIV